MNLSLQALNPWLVAGAVASAVAALLHVGCVIFGASWYRFMGAGEDMARMAEAGRLLPTAITLGITLVLLLWSAYALAAAGLALPLPWVRWATLALTAVYLLRGLGGFAAAVLLTTPQPGRSDSFWWWSSAICLAIGTLHAVGLRQAWHSL